MGSTSPWHRLPRRPNLWSDCADEGLVIRSCAASSVCGSGRLQWSEPGTGTPDGQASCNQHSELRPDHSYPVATRRPGRARYGRHGAGPSPTRHPDRLAAVALLHQTGAQHTRQQPARRRHHSAAVAGAGCDFLGQQSWDVQLRAVPVLPAPGRRLECICRRFLSAVGLRLRATPVQHRASDSEAAVRDRSRQLRCGLTVPP
jgi:hypothetical protein